MSYNNRLEDLIDHYFISNENLHKKKQMGGVGYLINGNMCFGIYEDFLVVRTGGSLAHTLIQKPGIDRFVPDDTSQEEFIRVEPAIYRHPEALHKFLTHGMDYTSTLPPKKDDESDLDLSDYSE